MSVHTQNEKTSSLDLGKQVQVAVRGNSAQKQCQNSTCYFGFLKSLKDASGHEDGVLITAEGPMNAQVRQMQEALFSKQRNQQQMSFARQLELSLPKLGSQRYPAFP